MLALLTMSTDYGSTRTCLASVFVMSKCFPSWSLHVKTYITNDRLVQICTGLVPRVTPLSVLWFALAIIHTTDAVERHVNANRRTENGVGQGTRLGIRSCYKLSIVDLDNCAQLNTATDQHAPYMFRS